MPRLDIAARIACAGAFLIAVLALVGWQFDLPVLRTPLPGSVAMNPLTALAFLLASISLWIIHRAEPATPQPVAKLAAALVAAIGTLKVLSLLTNVHLPLDQLLFHDKLAAMTPPNRMAPNTALAFAILGSGLLALGSKARIARLLATTFVLATIAISLAALIGYLYSARNLYGVLSFIPMAVNTALAFFLLSLGALLARPDSELMRLLVSQSPGGTMLRRVLPAAIVGPILLGWIRLEGQWLGLYGLEIGTALLMLTIMGGSIALLWLTARKLDATDGERRRAESALRESESRLQAILDNTTIVIYLKDLEGRLLLVNRRFEALTGKKRADIVGHMDSEVLAGDTLVTFRANDQDVLADDGPLSFERTVTLGDGTVRTFVSIKCALRDGAGHPYAICGVATEITDRKRAEERTQLLAERLEIANRELEAFSYSVSHDLRAPLRHIAGFVDLLLRQNASQLDETGKRRLTAVSESAQKMGQLIDDLLVFSRMGRTELQTALVDLNAVLQGILGELEHDTKGRNVRWVVGQLPKVQGDASMLRLVLTNLVGNAIKYTGKREEPVIEVGATDNGPEGMVVFVKDNGVGFDMEYAGKLFGVFQRLHRQEEFPGTGIGLANVRRIIQRHGGKTWAEGAPDQGATFYFSLPSQVEDKEEERWAA